MLPPPTPSSKQNMNKKENRTQPQNQTSSTKRPLRRADSSSSEEYQNDHNNNQKYSKHQRNEFSDHYQNNPEAMDIPLPPDKLSERRNSAPSTKETGIWNSVRRKKGKEKTNENKTSPRNILKDP